MRYVVCFNFLPKRRLSCPKGPRSHGFCGLTEAQAALNYVARSCLKSEGQQSFIPLAPHSWLRHIDSACISQRLPTRPVLRGAGDQDICKDSTHDSRGFVRLAYSSMPIALPSFLGRPPRLFSNVQRNTVRSER